MFWLCFGCVLVVFFWLWGLFNRFYAADEVHQLGGDASLAGAVVLHAKVFDEIASIFRWLPSSPPFEQPAR